MARRTLKQWVRDSLGITEMIEDMKATRSAAEASAYDMSVFRAQQTSFLQDEFNPARKAASDALGQKTIERLKAEDKARRHTLGES